MILDGSQQVPRNLFNKTRWLASGDPRHERYSIGVLGCGGGMAGAHNAGCVSAFEDFALAPGFDVAYGISADAANLAYFLSGQSRTCSTMYDQDLSGGRFVKLLHVRQNGGLKRVLKMDTDLLVGNFREGKKALLQDAVHRARTDFYVVGTCAETGEGVFTNAKHAQPGMLEALHGSFALPGIACGPITVDGRQLLDGIGGHPFPVKEIAMRHPGLTDLLILVNGPDPKDGPDIDPRWWKLITSDCSEGVQKAFLSRSERFNESLRWLRTQTLFRYLIVWVDKARQIKPLEQNAKKLKEGREESYLQMKQWLSRFENPVSAV